MLSSNFNKLNASRPAEATKFPDIKADISDIRVSVIKRDVQFTGDGFRDIDIMQIYYGYLVDGQWHDFPCENYELCGILSNDYKKGYDAAGNSNIVKIGPYLLIAVALPGLDNYFNRYNEISDTLGSEIHSITEYYTALNSEQNVIGAKCGYLKENIRLLNTDDFEFISYNTFHKWYYTVIEYDSLPTNYEMKIVTHTDKDGVDEVDVSILTYQDIQEALA